MRPRREYAGIHIALARQPSLKVAGEIARQIADRRRRPRGVGPLRDFIEGKIG